MSMADSSPLLTQPEHTHRLPARHNQGTKSKKRFICPICDEVIDDKKEDSIYCDGQCATWLHRRCAGLTKGNFDKLGDSDHTFHCLACTVAFQHQEILNLKSVISNLSSDLAALKKADADHTRQAKDKAPTYRDAVANRSTKIGQVSPSRNSANDERPVPKTRNDKKFNLVFHGINECTKGTHFIERAKKDHKAISSILQGLDSSLTNVSIRDTIRLGKYNPTSLRPRPILTRFNEVGDVMTILAKRRNLVEISPEVIIKPDMTKEQREVEWVLLKERKALIHNDTSKQDNRIRGNCLYVGHRLIGTAMFSKQPIPGDNDSNFKETGKVDSSVFAKNGQTSRSQSEEVSVCIDGSPDMLQQTPLLLSFDSLCIQSHSSLDIGMPEA